MTINAINNSDADLRRELGNNIIVTGGCSLVPGYVERLSAEVTAGLPGQRTKIIAQPNAIDRKYSSWIGGSILGSLGTLQQLWMSKQEYDEHGAGLVERKCP